MPFIRVTRGLKACDTEQQFKLLQQLPQLFKKHDVTSLLSDIIFAGICNAKFYEKIPVALLVDINASLPPGDQLHLEDSIYESRLVEEPNENEATTNQKKKKLPLTLLRIPNDLQYLLFHFMDYKELMNVQKVCRALCIAARNPSSIYALKPDLGSYSRNHKFLSEWLSRPRSLVIRGWVPNGNPIIGNTKWGQQVTHLSITNYCRLDLTNLGHFHKLTKCNIRNFSRILLNGQIASYSTLKELSLEGRDWTEKIINEIRKFENLEHLSLDFRYNDNENEKCLSVDPISFTKLKKFWIQFSNKMPDIFHRVLIGSRPESVTVHVPSMDENCILPQTNMAVEAIRAVRYLKINVSSMLLINLLHPLLWRAQRQPCPFLEQCVLAIGIDADTDILLPPIITLFQCAKQSKLKLNFWETYLAPKYNFERFVKEICDAPYGTFNEITVYISVHILTSKMDDVDWCEGILDALEDEGCSKEDHQAVRRAVMQTIDKAEEWVRAWLGFDVEKMREIGLRKLDIEFQCNLKNYNTHWDIIDDDDDWNDEVEAKTKRVDRVLDIMTDEWIQQRAERWSDIDKRCETQVNTETKKYTVSLTLQS